MGKVEEIVGGNIKEVGLSQLSALSIIKNVSSSTSNKETPWLREYGLSRTLIYVLILV